MKERNVVSTGLTGFLVLGCYQVFSKTMVLGTSGLSDRISQGLFGNSQGTANQGIKRVNKYKTGLEHVKARMRVLRSKQEINGETIAGDVVGNRLLLGG